MEKIKIINKNLKDKHFNLELNKKKEYKPGQFIEIYKKDKQGNLEEPRPYTLCSKNNKDNWELYIGVINSGKYSNYLKDLEIGSEIYFKGPIGDSLKSRINSKNLLIIALGSGISTYRTFLYQNIKDYNIELVYLNKIKEDMFFRNELKEMFDKYEKKSCFIITSENKEYKKALLEKIKTFSKKNPENNVLISGPPKAVEDLYNKIKDLGILDKNIIVD